MVAGRGLVAGRDGARIGLDMEPTAVQRGGCACCLPQLTGCREVVFLLEEVACVRSYYWVGAAINLSRLEFRT